MCEVIMSYFMIYLKKARRISLPRLIGRAAPACTGFKQSTADVDGFERQSTVVY